jgi:hypothetical protein
MRRIAAVAALAALLALLACRGGGEPGVKQYRAWCWTKSRPLGEWTTDRATAQAEVDAHVRQYPHHSATVKVFTGPLQESAR